MIAAARANADETPLEWAVAGRALAGEVESGDLHLVHAFPGGTLIAVIDGLGHGPEAAHAARAAAASLAENAALPATALVEQCHSALHRTRGVVLSLALVNAQGREMTWLGVGNVDGTLYRAAPGSVARESLPHRGGVVGYQLPALRTSTLRLDPGDTLVFATDGIASTFTSASPIGWHPQDAADHILRSYGKASDDALVLVARIGADAS